MITARDRAGREESRRIRNWEEEGRERNQFSAAQSVGEKSVLRGSDRGKVADGEIGEPNAAREDNRVCQAWATSLPLLCARRERMDCLEQSTTTEAFQFDLP